MTAGQLATLYLELNDRWFAGRLPAVGVRLSQRMTTTAGQYDARRREIAIAARFVEAHPNDVESLLLHEMVHVAIRGGHGAPFHQEWQRLRSIGAPVPAEYIEFRHCRQFTPKRPRPYVYECPTCGDYFPRTRPFREPRWCAKCSRRATWQGDDPFHPEGRLRRIAT